jgi:hypothetical protein
MKNKIKMVISGIIAIIFTMLLIYNLIIWIFHLYPRFVVPNYFGTVVFYSIVTGLFWLITRGYYLELKEEIVNEQ